MAKAYIVSWKRIRDSFVKVVMFDSVRVVEKWVLCCWCGYKILLWQLMQHDLQSFLVSVVDTKSMKSCKQCHDNQYLSTKHRWCHRTTPAPFPRSFSRPFKWSHWRAQVWYTPCSACAPSTAACTAVGMDGGGPVGGAPGGELVCCAPPHSPPQPSHSTYSLQPRPAPLPPTARLGHPKAAPVRLTKPSLTSKGNIHCTARHG